MAKRLRLKKGVKLIIAGIILLIIAIFAFIKIRENYLYHQSYQYHLLKKGYTEDEIKTLEKYYDEENLFIIAAKDKDTKTLDFMNTKGYKHKNLDRYLTYQNKNRGSKLETIVHLVNLNLDFGFYEKVSIANTDKKNLILVNKYFKLDEKYEPDNLVAIPSKYAWGTGQKIQSEVYDAFELMWKDANKEDIYLMINLGYRSYEDQEKLYNRYKDSGGTKYADSITARPGHSEHQTGLALDIFELHNSNTETFKETKAYTWLKENAYRYGFILRYDNNYSITGFETEDWHYRYVGKTAAQVIHDKSLTLEEYYYNEY